MPAKLIKIEYSIDKNECWRCTSHCGDKDGYPLAVRDGRQRRISRIMYTRHCGEIPKGLWVLHTCDNVKCINPDHLYVGTHSDNMRDREERGRTYSKLTQDQVDEIRKSELTYRALGKLYGVACSTISYIKNGQRWKIKRHKKRGGPEPIKEFKKGGPDVFES